MAKCLISEESLFLIHSQLHKDFMVLKEMYSNKFILPYEAAGIYILLYCSHILKKSWKGSASKEVFHNKTSFFPSEHFIKLDLFLPKKTDIYSFFKKYRIRHIPESAHNALIQWADGHYPLQLRLDIPSSLEVLKLQSSNQRIVSLFLPPPDKYILGERDPLSFTIHDLIHADHFFKSPEIRSGQVGFYKWIYSVLKRNLLQKYQNDSVFQKNLDYLISDMNSISLHLIMSFKTILLQAYIRSLNQPHHYRLTPLQKNDFESFFNDLFNKNPFSHDTNFSFLRLNEPSFHSENDGKKIIDFFNSYED